MHAARGGLASLELALNEVLPEFKDDDGMKRMVSLDRALAVKEEIHESSGMILAAGALML